MKVNYHTHTYRCNHADGSEEDYVLEAIKKGLSTIGFSDHGPYMDNRLGLRMSYSELNDYIDILKSLREKYKKQINILIGVEIEYFEEENHYYEYLLEKLKLDYLAFGQHVFSNNGVSYNSFNLTSTEQYIYYANSVSKALDTKYFNFLAHPDLVFVNNLQWDENCEKACDIIINSAKKNNTILEFNSNGIRRGLSEYIDGYRYPYPHVKFWEKVAREKIRVIINSDCHSPSYVWDEAVEKAYQIANELNLNIIYNIL